MRNNIIDKYKMQASVTNIVEEDFYRRLTLTVQGSKKGKRKVITFDWLVDKKFNINSENLLNDIAEKLKILIKSNFKYILFKKYLNLDRRYFSLVSSAYKLFKKLLGIKILQEFLE